MKFLLMLLFCVNTLAITLTEQNTMSLNGAVDSESVTGLMTKLQELNSIDTQEPIYLVINSPGGSVYDGFDFIRFALTSKRKIHTITLFSASMGFQIAQSLGTRYVAKYSTMMSHRVSGGIQGEAPGSMDTRLQHLMTHILEQDTLVVSRTKGKQTLQSYANLIRDEYWANSSKAINDGFADEEVLVECDKSLEGTVNRNINVFILTLNVVFSKCPLITAPISFSVARGQERAHEVNIQQELNNYFRKVK